MAVVIEIPIRHPARRPNPFNLRTSTTGLACPYCDEKFEGHWKLYLHMLHSHPERRDAQG